ncbi:MAG: hypothetical protein Q8R55_03075, partial [Candidatus Taylorbacteria bacterium]|nr:hypothetical protein [Candidatus Taylorbacteria bacterium]
MDSSESDKIESQNQSNTVSEPAELALAPLHGEETLGLEMMSFGGKTYIATSILSQKFGYDGDHIARLARQGKVESIKQGKRWYVVQGSLEEYRRKADENKRITASESIKSARRVSLEDILSRKPKIVPSLALFQIVERMFKAKVHLPKAEESPRASMVSLRPLFNNGFRLILLALFVFSLSWLTISRDISNNIDEENQTASIFSTIQSTLRFLFEPALDSIYHKKLEDRIAELEQELGKTGLAFSGNRQQIVQQIIKTEKTEIQIPVSPNGIESRLLILEDFLQNSRIEFAKIEERLSRTSTIIATPVSATGIPTTSTILNPYTIDSNTVKAQTLTVLGSGTVANDFTISGTASITKLSGAGLTDCDATSDTLNWDTTTGKFSCGSDESGGGGGGSALEVKEGLTSILNPVATISFDAGGFAVTPSGSAEVVVRIDYTNGPASRAADQTITGFWEFRSGASFSNDVEFYNTAGTRFVTISSTSLGRFSLGDSTPETYFEIASSSGIVASISNTFYVDGTNQSIGVGTNGVATAYSRFGTATANLPESNWIDSADDLLISDDLYVVGTGSFARASASSFFGTAFPVNGTNGCSGSTADKLLWRASDGKFLCQSDQLGGGSSANVEIRELGGGGRISPVDTISFEVGHFNITASPGSAVDAVVRLDWTNGPASRSAAQTITGFWEFRSGASYSNDVEYFNNLGVSFAKFATTSSGRFGIGDTTPEAYFEIASSSGTVASISNIFTIDATNKRVGIGTASPGVPLHVIGAASVSTNFEASGYASASQYYGGGLSSCNSASNALTWSSGLFGCNTITSSGGAQLGIEIINSGGTYGTHYGSISFDASHFTVTFGSGTTASESQVRLDWGSGGPASLSEEETVTKQWEFRNGASFTADLELYDNSNTFFAVFSSTSLGRFGLGDSTPETYFEIASSSGITASISNTFYVDG